MTSFLVTNRKGGCGKTTTAVNLAACLAEAGASVLLIDLDPQAHASLSLGALPYGGGPGLYDLLTGRLELEPTIRPTAMPGLSLLAADLRLAAAELELANQPGRETRLRDALARLRGPSHLVFDCPPSLGVLALNGLVAANRAIVPVQTHFLALEGLAQQMQTIYRATSELNPALRLEGVVPTMVEANTKLSRSVLAELTRSFGEQQMLPLIRADIKAAEAPSHGLPLIRYAPRARASADYRRLAQCLLERHDPTFASRHESGHPVQAL